MERRQKPDWIVRDNPRLQAELNQQSHKDGKLSSQIVNKVVDRIKDL
jgi:hypothetical protein